VSIASAVILALVLVTMACGRAASDERADTAGLTAGAAAVPGGGPPASVPAAATGESTTGAPTGAERGAAGPQRPPPGSPSSTPPRGTGGARTPPPPAPPGGAPAAAASSDTARGIVAVVGAVPITSVVLRPAAGGQITLRGPLAREIGGASGADVWVRGRRVDARTIEVASYAVRSVDGVTAITGTLTADGDRLVLVTDDGRRHAIARPPAPLREHIGARVWISGDLGTAITAYGILRPRR
jgi:hypothetical protein